MALLPRSINSSYKVMVMKVIKVVLVVLIFIFSAMSTYNLAINSFKDVNIAYMFTIIVEGAMMYFAYQYHQEANTSKFSTSQWACIILWFIYLGISMFSTTGSIMLELDNKEQQNVVSSPEYAKYTADVANIDNQISALGARLKSLTNDTSLPYSTKELTDINNRLATKRAELAAIPQTEKTKYQRQRKQTEISGLEKDKADLLKTISGLDKASMTKSEEVKSLYASMDKLNAEKVRLNSMPITKQNPFRKLLAAISCNEIIFWVFVCIIMELTRFRLLKVMKGSDAELCHTKKHSNIEFSQPLQKKYIYKKNNPSPTLLTMEKKQPIGFKATTSEFKKKDVINYINAMYDSVGENGKCDGLARIAKKASMKESLAREIHGHLKRLDILDVKHKDTFIKMDKTVAVKKINSMS